MQPNRSARYAGKKTLQRAASSIIATSAWEYKGGFISLNAERGVFISKCQMSSACVQKCMQRRMKFTTRESTECIKRIDALRVPPKLQVSRYEV